MRTLPSCPTDSNGLLGMGEGSCLLSFESLIEPFFQQNGLPPLRSSVWNMSGRMLYLAPRNIQSRKGAPAYLSSKSQLRWR